MKILRTASLGTNFAGSYKKMSVVFSRGSFSIVYLTMDNSIKNSKNSFLVSYVYPKILHRTFITLVNTKTFV